LKVTNEALDMHAKGPSDIVFHEFERRGHWLTIDSGRQDVAEVALDWLSAKGR
jgi:hypothetical protein